MNGEGVVSYLFLELVFFFEQGKLLCLLHCAPLVNPGAASPQSRDLTSDVSLVSSQLLLDRVSELVHVGYGIAKLIESNT